MYDIFDLKMANAQDMIDMLILKSIWTEMKRGEKSACK